MVRRSRVCCGYAASARTPYSLTVLCLLGAGPLHPYGIQRLIRSWGEDQVVNIGQRANLYKTIERLHEAASSPSARPSAPSHTPSAPSTG